MTKRRMLLIVLAALLVLPISSASASDSGRYCEEDGTTISAGPLTIECYSSGNVVWGSARVFQPGVIDYTQPIGRTGTSGGTIDDPNAAADGDLELLPYCWARLPGTGECLNGVSVPAGAYAEPTGSGWSIDLEILGGGGVVGVYGGCVDTTSPNNCEGPGGTLPAVFFTPR